MQSHARFPPPPIALRLLTDAASKTPETARTVAIPRYSAGENNPRGSARSGLRSASHFRSAQSFRKFPATYSAIPAATIEAEPSIHGDHCRVPMRECPIATPTHTLLTTLGIFATRAVDSSAWSFPDRFIGPGSMGGNRQDPQKEMPDFPAIITE